jgi:hypothetical protein
LIGVITYEISANRSRLDTQHGMGRPN